MQDQDKLSRVILHDHLEGGLTMAWLTEDESSFLPLTL